MGSKLIFKPFTSHTINCNAEYVFQDDDAAVHFTIVKSPKTYTDLGSAIYRVMLDGTTYPVLWQLAGLCRPDYNVQGSL